MCADQFVICILDGGDLNVVIWCRTTYHELNHVTRGREIGERDAPRKYTWFVPTRTRETHDPYPSGYGLLVKVTLRTVHSGKISDEMIANSAVSMCRSDVTMCNWYVTESVWLLTRLLR